MYFVSYLKENIDDDDKERVGQVEEEPGLHGLDVGGAGQAVGDREVDGGQDHQGGDVQLEDQGVPALPGEVDGGLVDDVHQDGGQVGHHEDAELLQDQMDFQPDTSIVEDDNQLGLQLAKIVPHLFLPI